MNNVQMGKHSLFAVHSDSICFGSHSNVLFCSQKGTNRFTVLSFRFFAHRVIFYYVHTRRGRKWKNDAWKYKEMQIGLSQVSASCVFSCIMPTVLLSYCTVPQACAVHLSRQLAKLSWLINNHAMVLDQCTSNVLRLSALFLLRLLYISLGFVNAKEGWGLILSISMS